MEQSNIIKKFFFMNAWFIAVIIIVIIAGFMIWYISSNAEPVVGVYAVTRGNVISSVDIPGTVSSSNSVDLSFQEAGQILSVDVKEGDSVTSGEALASLDDSTQKTQLDQEKETLAAAQANYEKLLAGATTQNIQTSQDSVNSANQNLNNAYTAIYNAYNISVTMQNNYFTSQDPQGIAVSASKNDINTNMQSAQSSLNTAEKSMAQADIDTATSQMILALNNVYDDVDTIRTQCDQGAYYYKVTVADKATLDAQKTTVNTSLTGVTALQQNIASLKLALKTAQDQLSVTTAPPTQADIDLAKAQIASAQAEIDNARLTIEHATITAPFSGVVRNVIAKSGMVVSPNVPVISIINNGVMKIDAYASETDVSKVQINDAVNVTLDAYGDSVKFPATVTAVDTAETIFDGSPAYHITLYFTGADDRILDGMTGNVFVATAEHDNVVDVPSRLILDDGGTDFVLLHNGKNIVRQKITLGLTGDDGMVEVLSGLNGGEKISDF